MQGNLQTRPLRLLQAFGITVDAEKNEQMVGGKCGAIEAAMSPIKVLVVPTDEELSIAEQTLHVVNEL